MRNRYDEAIKNIQVTDEMRNRILENINHMKREKAPEKVVAFPFYKKLLPLAACFLILVVGSFIVQNMLNEPSKPLEHTAPNIVSYDTGKNLSNALGFGVKQIGKLPFQIERIQYTSYWDEIAEVEYTGSTNTAVLRMAAGESEISGNYNTFTNVESRVINACSVTIKGNDNQYTLATWHKDGYSYSLQLNEPVSLQVMVDTIQSIV